MTLVIAKEEDMEDATRGADEVRHHQLAQRRRAEREIKVVEEADWLDELGVPVVTVDQLQSWTMAEWSTE